MPTGNRVQQTTTSTGSGDLALTGTAAATAARHTFADAFVDGEWVDVQTEDGLGNQELSVCRYNAGANTLTRLRVLSSTNGGAPVSWGAGTKLVYATIPAERVNGREEYPFAFGDASPAALGVVRAGKLVERVTVVIRTPFDGAGAAVQVGDGADAGRLLAAGDSLPDEAGTYSVRSGHAYGADTALLLTITPGAGATAGAGLLIIETQP